MKNKTQENTKNTFVVKFFKYFFLPVGALMFGVLIFSSEGDNKRNKKGEETVSALKSEEDMQRAAHIIAQNAMQRRLKSPASADFPLLDFKVISPADSLYVVRSYVDSQNGFGAMIRTNYTVTLRYLGGDELNDRNWDVQKVDSY